MKRFLTLALSLFTCGMTAQAQQQRHCGTELIREYLQQHNPELAANYLKDIPLESSDAGKPAATIDTIPVVFHIILTTAQQNQLGGTSGIIDRIQSQISRLNTDFGARNPDSTSIPSVFKPLYGRSNIRFGLAHTNPNGQATEGYEIITTTKSGFDVEFGTTGSQYAFSDAAYTSAGGRDAWNNGNYLNIWVINMTDNGSPSGILGLCKSPGTIGFGGFPPAEKGVYLNYGAFGQRTSTGQYYFTGYDKGRTLVHEVGHYFNLDHIWGTSQNPSCNDDDGVADTPPQYDANYGCPSFPKISCSNGPNGDMFMNYMDYCDDRCLLMFSNGQVTRMHAQTASGGPSYSLTLHPQLLQYPASVNNLASAQSQINVAPNPVTNALFVSFPQSAGVQHYTLTNSMGAVVANAAIAPGSDQFTIHLDGVAPGVYFLHCRTAAGMVSQKILKQ